MKKALVLAVVLAAGILLAVSLTAVSEWKYGAEQTVDVLGGNYPLEAYIGFDFDEAIGLSAYSIAGDFCLTWADLWPWTATDSEVTVDAELVLGYKSLLDVVLSSTWVIDYIGLPENIALDAWDTDLELILYASTVLTLNAGAGFRYDLGDDDFPVVFFFGFDSDW